MVSTLRPWQQFGVQGLVQELSLIEIMEVIKCGHLISFCFVSIKTKSTVSLKLLTLTPLESRMTRVPQLWRRKCSGGVWGALGVYRDYFLGAVLHSKLKHIGLVSIAISNCLFLCHWRNRCPYQEYAIIYANLFICYKKRTEMLFLFWKRQN